MASVFDEFDRLLDLDSDARRAALDAIAAREGALAERLRAMLAADAAAHPLLTSRLTAAGRVNRPRGREGEQFGAYRIERALGAGGMGTVWLAERTLGASVQKVALKFLRVSSDPRLLRQFDAERAALARLEHPTIARLIDAGVTDDGEPYLATEFVDGEPLLDDVRRHALPLDARLKLIEALCEAVDYAHRRLLIHRDLKPSNVLIDADGRPRLLDFGIAKALDAATIAAETLDNPLSPAYASPEQARGEPVSTATDVFGLGLLLYELLTGALPPQRSGSGLALLKRITDETIREPSAADLAAAAERDPLLAQPAWPKRLRGDLDQIVLKALRREPERRYPSAAALGADLKRFREGRPISARADSLGYRLSLLLKRHPWTSAALTAAVLGIAGASFGAWRSAERAELQAQRATRAQAFLLSTFASADPSETRGVALTAREVLASAARRVETEFADDPQQQLELLLAITEIYSKVDDQVEELKIANASLRRAEVLAPTSLDHGHALLLQAIALNGNSDYPGANEAARKAVAILEPLGPPARGLLGRALVEAEMTKRAGPDGLLRDPVIVKRGVDLVRAAFGEGSRFYASAINSYAVAVLDNGQLAEGRVVLERSLALFSKQFGDHHSQTLHTRELYADVLDRMGDSVGSRAQIDRVVASLRVMFNNRGNSLASALFNRGISLQSAGDLAGAERDYREVLTLTLPTDISHIHAQRYLANTLSALKRHDEAVPLLNAAIKGYIEVAQDETQRWRTEADLGLVLAELGQPQKAIERQRLALEELTRLVGPNPSQLIRPLRGLARSARMLKLNDESRAALVRAESLASVQFAPDHPTRCGIAVDRADTEGAPSAADRVQLEACLKALMVATPVPPVVADIQRVLLRP